MFYSIILLHSQIIHNIQAELYFDKRFVFINWRKLINYCFRLYKLILQSVKVHRNIDAVIAHHQHHTHTHTRAYARKHTRTHTHALCIHRHHTHKTNKSSTYKSRDDSYDDISMNIQYCIMFNLIFKSDEQPAVGQRPQTMPPHHHHHSQTSPVSAEKVKQHGIK